MVLINREQKRNQTKLLKAKGFDDNQIATYFALKETELKSKPLIEGQKVKLNLDNIKSHPDYERLSLKYKSWAESHKDNIFTVEYDKHPKNNIVCLAEDESDPKWLFWTGDLMIIEECENG